MSRFVDRGAITAAYVGIGMAVTIVVSFLLVIPIEWVIWMLALPSGLLIGYYANQRSDRRAGPWGRILVNGLFAGFVTGLTAAVVMPTSRRALDHWPAQYTSENDAESVTPAAATVPGCCKT